MALNVLKSVFSALNNVQHFIKWRRVAVTVSVLCRISQKTHHQAKSSFCVFLSSNAHQFSQSLCILCNQRSGMKHLICLPKSVKTTFWGKEFISYVEPLFIILLICF